MYQKKGERGQAATISISITHNEIDRQWLEMQTKSDGGISRGTLLRMRCEITMWELPALAALSN